MLSRMPAPSHARCPHATCHAVATDLSLGPHPRPNSKHNQNQPKKHFPGTGLPAGPHGPGRGLPGAAHSWVITRQRKSRTQPASQPSRLLAPRWAGPVAPEAPDAAPPEVGRQRASPSYRKSSHGGGRGASGFENKICSFFSIRTNTCSLPGHLPPPPHTGRLSSGTICPPVGGAGQGGRGRAHCVPGARHRADWSPHTDGHWATRAAQAPHPLAHKHTQRHSRPQVDPRVRCKVSPPRLFSATPTDLVPSPRCCALSP